MCQALVLLLFLYLHALLNRYLISISQIRTLSFREVSEELKVTQAAAELTFNLVCLTPR